MKRSNRSQARLPKRIWFQLLTIYLFLALPAWSAPQGGAVTAGSATITQAGPTTTITQTTPKAIINWRQYGIDPSELVQYLQPAATSVALNRVLGGNPSFILGALRANGHVWLLNPNGILFGQGSQVNVGGILASTLMMADQDFLGNNYHLVQGAEKRLAAVVNQGNIQGGEIALVAPLVYNTGTGTLNSSGQRISLAGTTEAYVSFDGQQLVNIPVQVAPVSPRPVTLSGAALDDVLRNVVNNRDILPAGSLTREENGGYILGGAEGVVVNSGNVTASATPGQYSGNLQLVSTQATVLTPGSLLQATGAGGPLAGNIAVTSLGNVQLDNSQITDSLGGDVTVQANKVTVNGSQVNVDHLGNTSLSAQGNLTFGNSSLSASHTNNVTIQAGNNVNILPGSNFLETFVADTSFVAGGSLALNQAVVRVDHGGNTTLYAGNNLTAQNALFNIANSSNLAFESVGSLGLTGTTVTDTNGQAFSILAANQLTLSNSFIAQDRGGNLTIANGPGSTANIAYSTIASSNSGYLLFFCASNVSMDHATLAANTDGDFLVMSAGDFSIVNSTIEAYHVSRSAVSARGNLGIANSTLGTSQSPDFIVIAGQNTNISGSTLAASQVGAFVIQSALDLGLYNSTVGFANGSYLALQAGGNMAISASLVIRDHTLYSLLQAGGWLYMGGSQVVSYYGSTTWIRSLASAVILNHSQVDNFYGGPILVTATGGNLSYDPGTFNVSPGDSIFLLPYGF